MAERRLEMTKLQGLNVFLTERLMLAAQDIYRAVESTVESTVLQYRGELRRERRENRRLRRTLTEAGIQWPEREPFGSLEFDEEDFLPVGKEPESEPSPLPEKQEYNPRSGESECGSLDSKSTPVVSHGNSDYTPDQTCVAAQHREHQSRLQDRREDDFVSISPSNQIKVETGAPAPEGLSLDAEGLSLDAECPPSAQSQGSVVSMMESDRLLSRFDAVQQFPQHLFQIHDGGGAAALSCTAGGGYTAKPCGRRLAHLNTHHLLHHHHHAGERGFLCGLCGKAFSSSGRLKGHQRIHTGEKPYQCHVCMKRFNQTAHLKVHLRVHTGEKPFSCPVCGKSFTQSNKVKRHLITHTRD